MISFLLYLNHCAKDQIRWHRITIYSFWPWFTWDINLSVSTDANQHLFYGTFALIDSASSKWNISFCWTNLEISYAFRVYKYLFQFKMYFGKKSPWTKPNSNEISFFKTQTDWPRSIKSNAIDSFFKLNFPLNFHSSMSFNQVWERKKKHKQTDRQTDKNRLSRMCGHQ